MKKPIITYDQFRQKLNNPGENEYVLMNPKNQKPYAICNKKTKFIYYLKKYEKLAYEEGMKIQDFAPKMVAVNDTAFERYVKAGERMCKSCEAFVKFIDSNPELTVIQEGDDEDNICLKAKRSKCRELAKEVCVCIRENAGYDKRKEITRDFLVYLYFYYNLKPVSELEKIYGQNKCPAYEFEKIGNDIILLDSMDR